jgi:hypothetical protein
MKVIHCDVCDSSIAKSKSFSCARTLNASGSMSEDSYEVDLCLECEVVAYRKLVALVPGMVASDRYAINATISAIIKDMIKKGREPQ